MASPAPKLTPRVAPLVIVPGGSDTVRQLAVFIRAHPTVTAALERWRDLSGLATAPIEARLMAPTVATEPPSAVAVALRLDVTADRRSGPADATAQLRITGPGHVAPQQASPDYAEPEYAGPGATTQGRVLLRRVALACGSVVLVEALNWYVPGRLPPDIAETLQSTNVPFGRAIESLGVSRLDVQSRSAEPGALFAQSAVVADQNGVRLAYVEETFLPSLLARHAA